MPGRSPGQAQRANVPIDLQWSIEEDQLKVASGLGIRHHLLLDQHRATDPLVQRVAIRPEVGQVRVIHGDVQVEVGPGVVLAATNRARQPGTGDASVRFEVFDNTRQERVAGGSAHVVDLTP